MTSPVVLIGFDAMDPGIARQMAEDGRLPTLATFFQDGAWSPVTNPPGLVVGSTWPSFWTGCSPSRHGFYCFQQLEPKSYKVRRYTPLDVAVPPFWIPLAEAGRRVCILDVPLVPLTRPANGIHIIDWGTHDRMLDFSTWPSEAELDMQKRPYPLTGRCDHYAERRAWGELYDVLVEGIERKTELGMRLLERGAWDVFATVYAESHCAGHQFWWAHDPQHPNYSKDAGDPLLKVYEALDRALAGVLSRVPNHATVVVLLSHGIGNHNGGDHLLFEIITRLEDAYAKKSRALVYREKGIRWLLRTWDRFSARDHSKFSPSPRWVDASRRFIRLPNNELYGGVRFNIAGREPRGRIQPGAELDELMGWLERELLALTDPHQPGRRLVRKVLRTRDVYAGELRDALPDMLIDWDRSAPISAAASERIGVVEREYDGVRSGDHRPTGMVLARGPNLTGGRLPHNVQMVDLAPTLAALAGVRLKDVDGVPIPGLVESEATVRN